MALSNFQDSRETTSRRRGVIYLGQLGRAWRPRVRTNTDPALFDVAITGLLPSFDCCHLISADLIFPRARFYAIIYLAPRRLSCECKYLFEELTDSHTTPRGEPHDNIGYLRRTYMRC